MWRKIDRWFKDLVLISYPGGREAYNRDEGLYGNDNMSHLVFWWRQVWHFLMGLGIGASVGLLNAYLAIAIVFIMVLHNEIGDARDRGYVSHKEILDFLFNMLGVLVPTLLYLYFDIGLL